MMPQPCPRMSSLIRPLAGVPACTGFEGPMLLGRGISGASGDKGCEGPKSGTAVWIIVYAISLPFRRRREGSSARQARERPTAGHRRAASLSLESPAGSFAQLATTREPMLTALGERD